MARRIFARGSYTFKYFESSKLPSTYRSENQSRKKTAETDAIFDNVRQMNTQADADPEFVKPDRMDSRQSFFQADEGLYTLAYNISKCHINELIFSALCRKLTT